MHEEDLMLKSNEKLLTYFSLDEDLIYILDKSGYFRFVNGSGCHLLGYSEDELQKKHFLELAAFENRGEISRAFNDLINQDVPIRFTCVLLTKFGKELSFNIQSKVFTENGEITGLIGVGRNTTELNQMEEKVSELEFKLREAKRLIEVERGRSNYQKSILEELNQLKSDFISNISHELRTPLASIIGFSETIYSDPNMPSDMRHDFIEIILNEGKRLAKLINEMLDLSRIEGGEEIAIIKSDFDLVELLNDIINSNSNIISERRLKISKEFPGDGLQISGDKERLYQAFNGLLNNAIKFTEPEGRISIIVQKLYKEVEVIITDTGVGIPEKDLPYIFEKFYRVKRPGTEIPGTGLGLVLVKQIVDLHKGFITVQSQINQGTTFIVKLPKINKVQ